MKLTSCVTDFLLFVYCLYVQQTYVHTLVAQI